MSQFLGHHSAEHLRVHLGETMRFGFCLSAFIAGCFMTVFMRANAPNNATADAVNQSEFILAPVQDKPASTLIEMEVVKRPFGNTKDGKPVEQLSLIHI